MMRMNARNFLRFSAGAALAAVTGSVAAQNGPPLGGPPPEMLKVCAAKASGDTCSATDSKGRVVSGTCLAPQSRPLACRPKRPPPPPKGSGPPPSQRP